jgi:hypothetical protein
MSQVIITVGDRVRFNTMHGQQAGTVTRIWGKFDDKNVTIVSDGRTFVRRSSMIEPANDGSGYRGRAHELASQMHRALIAPATGADDILTGASADLVEWCRSARELLADLAVWQDAR